MLTSDESEGALDSAIRDIASDSISTSVCAQCFFRSRMWILDLSTSRFWTLWL
jgi:hypothetical protein